MSYIGDLCLPFGNQCELSCSQPYTNACNELCVTSCNDSRAVIYPPPVFLTMPGPVLSSCPQNSLVTCGVPNGICNTLDYRGSENGVGLRGSLIYGGSNGLGNGCNYTRSCSTGFPLQGRVNYTSQRRYSRGNCGPC
ncbi:PREDICTED: feather keratin 3-like [Mesitornis unicolor]|uniref:feather keratin 3-like n=1 Tax=Mesitornis unicolor TaxID=54374 RepID=UPI000528B56A|nr:PREDICTED: feather keratin 3-like [Mesitornis unicolor]